MLPSNEIEVERLPAALGQVTRLMRGFSGFWWVAGGWALDLFLRRQTREHHDLDLLILQRDAATLRRHLEHWEVSAVRHGELEPWTGTAHASSVYARPPGSGGWALQLHLAEAVDDRWLYRHDPAVTLPLSEVGFPTGIPHIRPEIALLYKARELRVQDIRDFSLVAPTLDRRAERRLRMWLPDDHPWRPLISA